MNSILNQRIISVFNLFGAMLTTFVKKNRMLVESKLLPKSNLTTHIESLSYAKIIQEAILPKPRHFHRLFSDHFIIYEPLNYVSGDFYWVAQKGDLIYLAVGDCTGHGVPGAMLSVLAKSIIEYSVLNKGLQKTNEILVEVDKKFVESFSGLEEDQFNNDWFDVGLICIDSKKKLVHYSSANRKLLHVSDGNVNLIKGDKFPIGGWQYRENREFTSEVFHYSEGDLLYLGSDGMQDQIGGPKTKKFSSKRLHDLLFSVQSYPCSLQQEIIMDTINLWKGDEDQIDDICLIGIELS